MSNMLTAKEVWKECDSLEEAESLFHRCPWCGKYGSSEDFQGEYVDSKGITHYDICLDCVDKVDNDIDINEEELTIEDYFDEE